MKRRNRKLMATLAGAAWLLFAHHEISIGQTVMQVTDPDLAHGEVRKIDRIGGKLTIRHGKIHTLDMPPMTMVFRVADPKLFDGVKVGDKVMFAVGKAGSAYTVTRIEVIR